MTMRILSVHSHVAAGHVGNDAVVLPLQLLGAEVMAVHTLQFSNHPGHGAFAGRVFPAEEVATVLRGLAAHGALAGCDGVLSGYLGEAGTAEAVLEAVRHVREGNARARYACDPVLGDAGRLYVREEVAAAIRDRLIPAADIATPNGFELGYLTGMKTRTPAEIVAAARALAPAVVLVTSAITDATPDDAVDVVLCQGQRAWGLRTPRLARQFNGAGDMLAGLFLFHCLAGGDAVRALERSVAAVHAVLTQSMMVQGSTEMSLVAARDAIVSPPTIFRAEPIS
jgi:pyridoxine kinase